MDDRDYVVPDDIKALVVPVFAHRLISRSYVQNGNTSGVETILEEMLAEIPAPG